MSPPGGLPVGVTITKLPLRFCGFPPIATSDPPLRTGRLAGDLGAAGAGLPRRGDLPSRPGDHGGRGPGGVGEAEPGADGGRGCGWFLVGTYYLRHNSLALGAHVANGGYVVADHCLRQGIGSRLCQHSLQAARRLGFRLGALQSPVVITSNAYTD